MARVRIENKNNYDVRVTLMNGVEKYFKPHSFLMIEKDDIEFLSSTSTIFSDRHLTIVDEDVAEEIGLDADDIHYIDDEELKKKLRGGKINDFKKFIDEEVNTLPMIIRIREMIEKMDDLQVSRVKYINEAFEGK